MLWERSRNLSWGSAKRELGNCVSLLELMLKFWIVYSKQDMGMVSLSYMQMATRGENTLSAPRMLRQTYLLLCELLGNGIDFIIREVNFDQRVRLPPVLGQL